MPLGAAHAAAIDELTSIVEESLRRYEPTDASCSHTFVECRVNGLMSVVLSSHRTPKMSGKYAYTVPSPSPSARWVKEKDQSCHHEVWMHLAHANPRGDRAAQYKHARQVHLKERASPFDHSTQRRRARRDQSDHFA